jgi:hypothetical protein
MKIDEEILKKYVSDNFPEEMLQEIISIDIINTNIYFEYDCINSSRIFFITIDNYMKLSRSKKLKQIRYAD